MTIEEFKKLKVKDKVRIKTLREIKKEFTGNPREGYDSADSFLPEMYEYAGEVVTIIKIVDNSIIIKEDPERWYYSHDVIKEKAWDKTIGQPTVVMHLIRGNKTIVKLSNGKVGIAKCSPEDEFDVYEGLRIAAARAYGKELFETEEIKEVEKVKEVKRVACEGEYIKLTNPDQYTTCKGFDKNQIVRVIHVYEKKGDCITQGEIEGGKKQGHFYPYEYVVLENYKPKK